MPIIRCPKCHDSVEIENDWYGRRIACPACDHQFTPRRSMGEDDRHDRDDDRPRRRRSRYDDDDRPAKKGGNAVLWVVLSLVGVFVVLPCLGCVGFVIWGMTAKETFAGTWTEHSVTHPLADSQPVVRASFPKNPVSRTLNDSTNGGTGSALGFSQMVLRWATRIEVK